MAFAFGLAFSATLVVAGLLSRLAQRSLHSSSVLFLAAGGVFGRGGTGLLHIDVSNDLVANAATIALFAVLFSAGLKVSAAEVRGAWRLLGRALLVGLPLTWLITAALAYFWLGSSPVVALLIATVLAPTDPVFARAIVEREPVPLDVRRLLNVESGLNDGLALPVVLGLVSVDGSVRSSAAVLFIELIGGVAIGVMVSAVCLRLSRIGQLSPAGVYRVLYVGGIAGVTFSLAGVLGANEFLAAFSAGVTVASLDPIQVEAFESFGKPIAEVFTLLALMLFGSLVTPSLLADIGVFGWLFAASVLFVARPVAVLVALLRSRMPARQRVVVAWFGPKGFASVVYALIVLEAGATSGTRVFQLTVATVALSIVLHSSSDVALARWVRG